MTLTINNFHDIDEIEVEVTHFISFSNPRAHARPGGAAWAEPPEGGEIEYDITHVEMGYGPEDCDPEDWIPPEQIIEANREELDQWVFEAASEDDSSVRRNK